MSHQETQQEIHNQQNTLLSRTYKPYLLTCYNLANGTNHSKDHNFTNDELFSITPEQIYQYLAVKAYGIPNPTENDHPTEGRASSLAYAKKAISSFMPNKLMAWNERNREGNPTRSPMVNNLIKTVKKKEVRKLGRQSQACRLMQLEEL
jgi:hypothetical protein